MKTIIYLSFSILILLCSCNQPGPSEKAEVSIDQQEAIKNKLETIAKDFLKSWERSPGAVTLTCREEENDWKIVHYHGSHGDPEIVKE